MRKWRKPLIMLCWLAVSLAVIIFLFHDREPRYKGRSLSEWLLTYEKHAMTQQSPDFWEAEQAVKEIGTNAVPFLLQWIRQEPPHWRKAARSKIPEAITQSFPTKVLVDGPGEELAGAAVSGFSILGTNAIAAIPELNELAQDATHLRTASRALFALSCLGAPALPLLTNAVSNTNYPYRDRIPAYLATFMAPSVGTNECLPAILTALNDPDPKLRRMASWALEKIAPGGLTNAPAP